jgi:hypothetical protein
MIERSAYCAKACRDFCEASCHALWVGHRGFKYPSTCTSSQPWALSCVSALCRRCWQAYRRSETQGRRSAEQTRDKGQSIHGDALLPLTRTQLADRCYCSLPRRLAGRVVALSPHRKALVSRWRLIRSCSTLRPRRRSRRRIVTSLCSPSLPPSVPTRATCQHRHLHCRHHPPSRRKIHTRRQLPARPQRQASRARRVSA